MRKYIFLFTLAICCTSVKAQELNVGVKAQKTHFMYWESGVSAQYSFANFKPGQFYLGVDYVTSRLGTAFNSNAIKQDNFLASLAWYSGKGKQMHFVTKLNGGYFKADLGESIFDELPATAVLVAPEIGLSYHFSRLPININVGAGYNIGLSPEGESPGTLQPLYYNAVVYYRIF